MKCYVQTTTEWNVLLSSKKFDALTAASVLEQHGNNCNIKS